MMLGERSQEIYPYTTTNGKAEPMPMPPAHDWEDEHRRHKDFWDDGTTTYFWRAHRITVLVIFSLVLLYVALFEEPSLDPDYNAKRGLVAVILAFVLFGVIHIPDGPFRRPHPCFWRFMVMLSIVYELFLVFLLFQNAENARALLKHIDADLGKPLAEKEYGGKCVIYDESRPEDPLHNVWDKMDGFVAVHFFGWWTKTLILRDWWLCMVISIMFEFLEYTLEHQLPNFSECWWDHWIMDALVCNGAGIWLGMKTLNYLSMKPYHWRGMWNIPSYRGKVTRVLKQFTPYVWMDFDWRPTMSLKRWISMLWLINMFLLAELNTFYLKFVLWIPPPHFLCMGRLVLFLFWGAVAMRETFQFFDDPNCKKFGTQAWIVGTIIVTEILLTLKFDMDLVRMPLPQHISAAWVLGLVVLLGWTLWHFYLQRLLWHTESKLKVDQMEYDDPDGEMRGAGDYGTQQRINGSNGASQHHNNNGNHDNTARSRSSRRGH